MNIDTKINRNFVRVVVEKSLLICHGLPYEAGSVIEKSYSDLACYFALKGFNSVIFDFTGTGLSYGDFSLLSWVEDLQLLASKFNKVDILGYSMGGAVAIRAAAELENVERLVVVASPCNAEMFSWDVLRMIYENARLKGTLKGVGDFENFVAKFKSEFIEIEPEKWISKVNCDKLIVHGTNDEIVPFYHGSKLFELSSKPKTFVKVLNGSHFLRQEEKVSQIIVDWLSGKIKEEVIEIRI